MSEEENKYYYLSDYVGEEITYRELCELVGEEMKQGSRKTHHLKNLGQYLDLICVNRKIIINGILNSDQIQLKEKTGKFTTYIENLLVMYLATKITDEEKISLTYKDIMLMFQMVNKDYFKAKSDKREYIPLVQEEFKVNRLLMDKLDVKDMIRTDMGRFFTVTHKMMKEIILNALKSMKQRSLILYDDGFRLYKRVYNPNNDSFYVHSRDCSTEEIKFILDTRKETMKEFGVDKIKDLIFLDKETRDKFNDSLYTKIKNKYNYDFFGSSFNLTLGEESIKFEYQKLLTKNKLNENIKNKLLTTKELKCLNTAIREIFIDMFI